MIYFQLFYEFFKIGLFAVGGGMATLPFLQRLGETSGWFDSQLITDMVAISESTPGPIGINMATYVGYNVGGIPGGIIATLGVSLPSLIIVIIFSIFLNKIKGNKNIDYAFYGMRPAVTGLIVSAAIVLMEEVSIINFGLFSSTGSILDLFSIGKIAFFVIIFILIKKFKKHPIVYIAASAVIGIFIKF